MSQASRLPGYKGPFNPNPGPGDASIVIYNYVPSLALGVVAVVCFAIALVGHFVLWVLGPKKIATHHDGSDATLDEATGHVGDEGRTKKDKKRKRRGIRTFEFLIVFGSLMELVGYGFRLYSHYSPFKVNAFVIQYFFIVCAPVFFSASFYLSLQFAIAASPGNWAIAPIKRLFTPIFITADVLTTIIQIVGAALIGVSESNRAENKPNKITPDQANDILLAGLALQCASFLLFLVVLGSVIWRSSKARKNGAIRISSHPEVEKRDLDHQAAGGMPVQSHLPTYTGRFFFVLVASSLLIFLRTLFRLGETAEGIWSYASSNEWLFGVFEFAPVVLALWLWLVFTLRSEMARMIRPWGNRTAV